MLPWLYVRGEMQICIWPSSCHCHSLSLTLVKSRLVLVRAHPGNPGQSPESCKLCVSTHAGVNVCVCVCVCASVCVLRN